MFGESQGKVSDIQAHEQTCQSYEEENEIPMLNLYVHMSVKIQACIRPFDGIYNASMKSNRYVVHTTSDTLVIITGKKNFAAGIA
jgi:hypothetical protein